MRTPIADLRIVGGAFELDSSLRTAVTISLLSYARARPGDRVPDNVYVHGWWGDGYSEVVGDSFGSRLWTLAGLSPREIAERAPALAEDALAWLVQDALVSAVSATAVVTETGQVDLVVELT